MITRKNYEIWFLDFAEGKLNPDQQNMLFTFLQQHPDLKKEFDAFDNVSLTEIHEPTPKFDLKKKTSWLLEKYSVDELVFNVCEGNLTAEELREWNDLKKARPDLANKVVVEKKAILKPLVHEKAEFKVLLKKQESGIILTPENYQEYFIAYVETKNLALYTVIQKFIAANPAYQREFDLVQKTIVKPDLNVVFEHKNELKQTQNDKVVGLYWWMYAAVAACLVLGVFFFYEGSEKPKTILAESNDTLKQPAKKILPVVQPEKDVAHVTPVSTNQPANSWHKTNKQNKKQQLLEQKNNTLQKQTQNTLHNNTADLVPNSKQKQDTTANKQNNVVNQPQETLANNTQKTNVQTTSPVNEKASNTPLEFVASVVNKKYYEEKTPKNEQNSPFYAMKNVVNTVSSGNADIARKEDSEYKEFAIKVGNFKFSRKKVKNREED